MLNFDPAIHQLVHHSVQGTDASWKSESWTSLKRSGIFKTDLVVHSVPQFLFAAEVTFRGLNRSV
jgi:hypothetical protein